MKRSVTLTHEFVEYIPSALKDGMIYVSMTFATAVHKCCCGCGNEVVTPLSPTDWKLIFDGVSISLDPSIGNWGFDCKSHYFIRRNKVIWAPQWSSKKIDAGRSHDAVAKERYFDSTGTPPVHESIAGVGRPSEGKSKESRWKKLIKWLS
jgi:hypothetical protein